VLFGFDEVFRSEAVEVIRLPFEAPQTNSFAERFCGTARRECLDHLPIFGRRHLLGVLTEFLDNDNKARPHQGLDQRVPRPPADVIPLPTRLVERRDRLGGLIHEYFRAA